MRNTAVTTIQFASKSGHLHLNKQQSREWGVEKSELPWEQSIYSRRCVSCRTISLPSFNGMRCNSIYILDNIDLGQPKSVAPGPGLFRT